MRFTSLILSSIICPQYELINKTNTWTEHDQYVLTLTVKECSKSRLYETCLKRFTKAKENTYSFTCGKP